MNKKDVIIPSGMLNYRCGQSGRCCGGWNIGLDKTSYHRLKKILTNNKMSKLFNEFVKRYEAHDKGYFAMIQFKDGQCGFLDKEGLCTIHKNFGIEALPDICKVFPRLVYDTPFAKVLSITFACPNACELLKSQEKIKKIKNPEQFRFAHGNAYYGKITKEVFERNDIKAFYFELEDHFIDIIQSRVFTIEERLILLGLSVQRLEGLVHPSAQTVQEVLNLDRKLMLSSDIKESIQQIQPSLYGQVSLLKEFIQLRMLNLPEELLKNFFNLLCQDFSFDQDDSSLLELSVDKYVEFYQNYFSPKADDFQHILENYLVYFILRKHFVAYNLREAYFLTIFFYSLIRLMAMSIAHQNKKELDEEQLIKAIWIIEKAIGHSSDFYNNIIGFLKTKEQTSLSHAITLLKVSDKKRERILAKSV